MGSPDTVPRRSPTTLPPEAVTAGIVGLALLATLRWPALRSGVLAAATATLALHAVNHWVDLGEAHRDWVGVFDGVTLTGMALLGASLTASAMRGGGAEGAAGGTSPGAPAAGRGRGG
ncbi:MAG: hypothetical protein M0P31_00925 [Solirubrobacteraceae bacterium]|nr:hypothetical protein [Solirubrobacteraceae bacterium]